MVVVVQVLVVVVLGVVKRVVGGNLKMSVSELESELWVLVSAQENNKKKHKKHKILKN